MAEIKAGCGCSVNEKYLEVCKQHEARHIYYDIHKGKLLIYSLPAQITP